MDQAKKKALVNSAQWGYLLEYLEEELDAANRRLQNHSDTVAIYRTQGQIEMMSKLKRLREMVNNG